MPTYMGEWMEWMEVERWKESWAYDFDVVRKMVDMG